MKKLTKRSNWGAQTLEVYCTCKGWNCSCSCSCNAIPYEHTYSLRSSNSSSSDNISTSANNAAETGRG